MLSTGQLGDADLKDVLQRIAINQEVVAAVSNAYTISPDGNSGMLKMWIDGMRQAGVTNFMVICIDDQVMHVMQRLNVPYWRKVRVSACFEQMGAVGVRWGAICSTLVQQPAHLASTC